MIMVESRVRRLQALGRIIRDRSPSRQGELVRLLGEEGFPVTQATISRDLEELGAFKTRRDGRTVYALGQPESASDEAGRRLRSIVGEWVISAAPAGNLVVIKTPPGSAHLVGLALDQAKLPRLIGTICGDDTLFLALADPHSAETLCGQIDAMIGPKGLRMAARS